MTAANGRASWALLFSTMLHAALAFAVGAISHVLPVSRNPIDRREVWAGATFEVDGLIEPVGVVPVERGAADVPPVEAPATPEEPERAPPQAPALPAPMAEAHALKTLRLAAAAPDGPAASAQQSEAAEPRDGGGSAFGAAGLPLGVRNLGKAFTRALPVAAKLERAWNRLPVGQAGEARIRIRVDDEGRIESAEPQALEPDTIVPSHLRNLLERAVRLIQTGRFALTLNDRVAAGSETLRVTLVITMREASDQVLAEPDDTVDMGFEPPTAHKPGRAWFTLASGRHVEAQVRLEP